MYKAIVFSRVSTEKQDLVQQTDEVFNEALKNGYKEKEIIFIEQKESAIKLDEEARIGLTQLKDSIDKYPIECVFVYEISRISRRPKVIYSIRDLLIEKQIQLICIKPYIKLLEDGKLSQTASLMFSLFASLSESEMMLKKERMRRGANHAKALGRHIGGYVTFGYTTDKEHRYIIDDNEARTVKWIFEEYIKNEKSTKQIVQDLREKGIFSDISFHGAMNNVYCILKREEYTGTEKAKPQIISKELFKKAQDKMNSNKPTIYRTKNMSLLKGLLIEETSGHVLNSNMDRQKYYCKQGGVSCVMSKLDPPLWNIAVTLHKSLKTIGTKQLEAKLSKRISEIFMIRGSQVEKKQDIQAKIDKIEERLILGKISEAKAEELEKSLYDEIKIIDDRATELNNEIGELGRRLDHIKKTGDTTLDYDNLNEDDRFNVTHEVFDKILVRRTSRFTLELKIYNKINDKVDTIEIKTYASVRKWRK